jgi:hypothetical protein
MGTQKLCACDRARQTLVSVNINFVDTVKQPFTEIVKDLSEVTHHGLWMNPFRGIPRGPRLTRFDVIYLDENCKVLDCIENFAEAEFAPIGSEAASALILPAHSLTSSQIKKGDQLRICSDSNALAGFDDMSLTADEDGSLRCSRRNGFLASQAQKGTTEQQVANEEAGQYAATEKPSLTLRVLRWLFPPPTPSDRRRGERSLVPELVAYYWTGGRPQAYQIGNVSQSGLFLLTEERWLPGTRIVMTLQRSGDAWSEEIHRVESEVIRWGVDGVGCAFVESGFVDLNNGEVLENRRFDREAFEQFLCRASSPAAESTESRVQQRYQ